jgi:signal transduction histidine kinase
MSLGAPAAWSPTEQVQRTLFRILAVLRLVVLGYAVVVNVGRMDEMARPGLAWAGLAAMVLWTLLADAVYELVRHRPLWFFVADVVVACGLLMLTLATHSDDMRERGVSSLPTLWVMGAVLAVAIGHGWWQGLVAAVCVSIADVAVRVETSANTWANIFLLMVAAAAVGRMSTALCRAAEARAATERLRAALEERARLARVVHDGVLQVLAMVQRRTQDSEEYGDLARLAAEQEASLRSLVQYDARTVARPVTSGPGTDLVHALEQVAGGHSLSGPGGRVTLPDPVVAELTAAVSECLLNVSRHVGDDARAWVLVEELGEEVVVTVRDEGPGIAADRLAVAAAEGRMGVSESIRGRLRDLGGRAELTTGPTIGTEWELHVPRRTDQGGPAR